MTFPYPHKRTKVLGRGNNGAVLTGQKPGTVTKWTVDPVEVKAWLVASHLQARRRPLPGIPYVHDIRVGRRQAIIVRDDVRPFRERGTDGPFSRATTDALHQAARLETVGRLTNRGFLFFRPAQALRIRALGRQQELQPMLLSLRKLNRHGAQVPDVRQGNMGRARSGKVEIFDLGRAPLEATAVARGEAQRVCPNNEALRDAITGLLGTAPSYKSCRVVHPRILQSIMTEHGWRAQEIDGTAGFHTTPSCDAHGCGSDILLREGSEWAQLHELVHAAGVVDEGLAVWATEGITEATAQEIARKKGWTHHPTYPREVQVVKDKLAPLTGTNVLGLGQLVIKERKKAGKTLAGRLADRTGVSARAWYKGLGPGALGPDVFLRTCDFAKGRKQT